MEYEYAAVLDPPLSVGSGQLFWVEIHNDTGDACVWSWETAPEGADGNGTSLYDAEVDGYDSSDLVPYDLSFCVSGILAAMDCNANGIEDILDIIEGPSEDCQPNEIPDECEDDLNANGIPDQCDIVSGTSKDLNFNGAPDEVECFTAPGDLDGDCDIDRDDLALFLDCMMLGEGANVLGCPCADFDANLTVDFNDYLAFSVAVGQPVPGCKVLLADACPDSWTTGSGGLRAENTFYDFGLHGPIPAGFFGDGSDPFGEIVTLVGTPADPNGVYGETDTQIQHGPVIFDPLTGIATTSLDIITLELVSQQPIVVTSGADRAAEEWLVVAGLSPYDPGEGELIATLDDPDGNAGSYDATVYVQPVFLFVKLQDLVDHVLPECMEIRILDTGEPGAARATMPPITLTFADQPFVRVADPTIVEQMNVPGCAQGNFVPGVVETSGGGRANQQLTCTSHITQGEAHYFCPPECDGPDVCKYSKSGGPTPVFCSNIPSFPARTLGMDCVGGFCLPFMVKFRNCVGSGFAIQTYGSPSCVSRESTCDGACCDDQGNCTLSTSALCDCAYKGDGTQCGSVTCGSGPACCDVGLGSCVDISDSGVGVSMTLDECPRSYRLANGYVLAPNACSNPFQPTQDEKDNPNHDHTDAGVIYWGPSFKGACDGHDNNYSDCTKEKATADNIFRTAMESACTTFTFTPDQEHTADERRMECRSNAGTYFQAVNWFGGDPYDDRQRDSCDCCCI